MKRNSWRCVVSCFVLLTVVLQIALPGSLSADTVSQGFPPTDDVISVRDWQEDTAEQSEYRRVFRQGDVVRERFSMAPMLQADSSTGMVPFDGTVVPDNGEFTYRSNVGPTTVRFTDKSSANRVRFEHKGRSVTFDVPGQGSGPDMSVANKIKVQGNALRYEDPGSPVWVEYTVGPVGVLEDIWIERPGATHKFAVVLDVDGVMPEHVNMFETLSV